MRPALSLPDSASTLGTTPPRHGVNFNQSSGVRVSALTLGVSQLRLRSRDEVGAGPCGVGRRRKATQADATPFAAAKRGRRRILEELGLEIIPRTPPGLSRLLGAPRSHTPPLLLLGRIAAIAAAQTRVRDAARPPSPPCPRIKVMPPGPRGPDSSRLGLPSPLCGLGKAQAAVTFPSPYLRAAGNPGAILGSGVELGSYSCLPI